MNVYLIVKAKVPKNIVNEFDEWYQKYHLSEAHFSFKSLKAFRCWINVPPAECTIDFGLPVVPDEYIIYKG